MSMQAPQRRLLLLLDERGHSCSPLFTQHKLLLAAVTLTHTETSAAHASLQAQLTLCVVSDRTVASSDDSAKQRALPWHPLCCCIVKEKSYITFSVQNRFIDYSLGVKSSGRILVWIHNIILLPGYISKYGGFLCSYMGWDNNNINSFGLNMQLLVFGWSQTGGQGRVIWLATISQYW